MNLTSKKCLEVATATEIDYLFTNRHLNVNVSIFYFRWTLNANRTLLEYLIIFKWVSILTLSLYLFILLIRAGEGAHTHFRISLIFIKTWFIKLYLNFVSEESSQEQIDTIFWVIRLQYALWWNWYEEKYISSSKIGLQQWSWIIWR